jgi:regulator of nucleoside diphosphate kinase
MADRDIFITQEDYDRLMRLLEGTRQRGHRDLAHVEQLDAELDRAHIVPGGEIPPDVVTMNSRVALRDLDTGGEMVLTLVFPHEANLDQQKVSVLAPLGTAVLGYRDGDIIEWQVPGGTRRLQIKRVLYQPEAAVDSGPG